MSIIILLYKCKCITFHFQVSFPRESDGRKHIPKDLWQQYPMETDELIEYKDFFEGFRPEFDKECAYDWEVFNEDIADLKKEEYRWNRHLLVHPGYIKVKKWLMPFTYIL